MKKGNAFLVRRDTGEKIFVALDEVSTQLENLMDGIQQSMYDNALADRESKTSVAINMDEFKKNLAGNPGFIKAMWCGNEDCEDKIKEDTGATLRCIPFEQEDLGSDRCVCCGQKAEKMAYFARAY